MPARITVNGETLSEPDIRAEAASLRASLEANGEQLNFEQRLRLRDLAIEALIERTLLLQQARHLNLAGAEAVIEHWGRKIKPVTPNQVLDYYRNHEFTRPESVHASHIVKNSEGVDIEENRRTLDQVHERLLAGEVFATLATAHSDCPEDGGDLGFFARGVMVPEFDSVVFSAPLHQPTPIFETPFGLHIAVVHERRPAGVPEFPEVAQGIANALYREKLDREVGIRLAALRKSARIEIT